MPVEKTIVDGINEKVVAVAAPDRIVLWHVRSCFRYAKCLGNLQSFSARVCKDKGGFFWVNNRFIKDFRIRKRNRSGRLAISVRLALRDMPKRFMIA
jgi:hypothetical protein